MINNNIDVNVKLHGQYKLSVIENNKVVYTTPWSNNTILSCGLVDLYTYSIPEVINYLDLGTDTSLSGVEGYGLAGVVTQSVLSNIKFDNFETYQYNVSSKTYHATFTTPKVTIPIIIAEFAIKRDSTNAFARNVFSQSYSLQKNQLVNFEYRLTLNWSTVTTTSLPVTGNNTSYTYNIPITSTTYNIPYDRVYYNNNILRIINGIYKTDQTTDLNYIIPPMGDAYFPGAYSTSLGKNFSDFIPEEIATGIDNVNRKYSVSTQYKLKLGAETIINNQGVNSNTNALLLVKDGNTNIPTNKFNITYLAYPIILYKEYNKCVSGIGQKEYVTARENTVSLIYNYTWQEYSL